MYVRWKSRKLGKRYRLGEPGSTSWRAELVENHRIDGKPRQKHIASLVSFTDDQLTIPAQICFIWRAVYDQLDRLDLPEANRKKIMASVAAKVPKRTRRQCEANERQRRAKLFC
jgi:hypothetical protein